MSDKVNRKIILKPDLDERLLDGYYFQSFFCRNCNNPSGIGISHIDVMIKEGLTRPKKLLCPNCKTDNLV